MKNKAMPGAEDAAQTITKTCMRQFESTVPGSRENWNPDRFEVSAAEWPVPHLVRHAFLLIGCQDLGRAEKVAWYIPFNFSGRACAVSLQKFGLRLYIDRADGSDNSDTRAAIVQKVNMAVRIIESKVLKPFAEGQVALGRVTIVNQYHTLRRSYEYFREGARLGFAGEGRSPKSSPGGGIYIFAEETEGFYNFVAALTAYLSMLEHLLVLALPFVDFKPETENLTNFIGRTRWREKYSRVLGNTDKAAVRYRRELIQLIETWRNTYSHGGFDKAHSTIHFHMPGVGAIPASFFDVRESPQFRFVPAAPSDFESAMALLDEFDDWLRTEALPHAMKWIDEAGLDVAFDQQFRDDLTQAIEAGKLDDLVDYHAAMWERNANMDW